MGSGTTSGAMVPVNLPESVNVSPVEKAVGSCGLSPGCSIRPPCAPGTALPTVRSAFSPYWRHDPRG